MKKMIVLLMTLLFVLTCFTAFAEEEGISSASAKSMRLKHTEGTVSLTDTDGNPLSMRVNMRLYSGSCIATEAESRAAVQLDDAKAVTVDESSSAEIRQNKKALEILVKNGRLFFNVTKPLESDESFEISTSTMVLGIRGTSGYVHAVSEAETIVVLFTGHAQITAWNGEQFSIEEGQRIRVVKTGEGTCEFQTEKLTEEESEEGVQQLTWQDNNTHGAIWEEIQKLDKGKGRKMTNDRPVPKKEEPASPTETTDPTGRNPYPVVSPGFGP